MIPSTFNYFIFLFGTYLPFWQYTYRICHGYIPEKDSSWVLGLPNVLYVPVNTDSGLVYKSIEGALEAPAQLILQLGILTRDEICIRKGKLNMK